MTESTPELRPKVTVYVAVHNYGRYLSQCLASVCAQSLTSWELLIYDDGSTDESASIASSFAVRDPERICFFRHQVAQGLRACANAALERARGEYIIRLDADDFLDENALLVLSSYLDRHPDVGLVYPNWIYVNEIGTILGVEIRKRVETETEVLDLPAHGACTLVRRRVLKAVGGYDLRFSAQDGHELWLKALHRFRVGNVQTPLFFYRRHGESMSNDEERLLESRRQIKRSVAAGYGGAVRPRIAVIVPVKNHYPGSPNLALNALAGRPLLDYTLDHALGLADAGCVLVTSDDVAVMAHCQSWPQLRLHHRSSALSEPLASLDQVVLDAVTQLEQVDQFFADILVVLSVHTPLRRPAHIREAIDTLLVYDVDQVLSTYEDLDLHFRHERKGLTAINAGAMNTLRLEREGLYAANGAIQVLWRDAIGARDAIGGRIGHIVMSKMESLQAKKPDERRLLDWLLAQADLRPAKVSGP